MYRELDRPPLRAALLRRALVAPRGDWAGLDVVARTGSTNADLLAAARAGAPDRTVLVAEQQDAGRGRLGRRWSSPPRAGLTCSVLLRPVPVPVHRWGWLPLLAGVALARVVDRLGEIDVALKWPNDLLVGPAGDKVAGILAEASGTAVVLGIGLNVTTRADELPPGGASLALAGAACTDREALLRALLRGLAQDDRRWREAGGDPAASGLRAAYRTRCATLGELVRVCLPDGGMLEGLAVDVDSDGRLVLRTAAGESPVAAGDVRHVRPLP